MIGKPGLAAAGVAAVMAGIAAPVPPAAAAELTLVSDAGERNVMNRRVFAPWANEVARLSGGALTVRMAYDSTQGRGGAGQFARAADGAADLAWGRQGDAAGRFRRTLLIELPGTGKDPVDATRRLWRAYDRHLAPEYAGVRLVALWAGAAPLLHTKNRPVRRIRFARGLKIRTRSPHRAWLLRALGATPVSLPDDALYDAMDRSQIHGVLASPGVLYRLRLDEVTRAHSAGLGLGHTPFFAVMNETSYRGLSKAQRDIIDSTGGIALSIRAAQVCAEEGRMGRDRLKGDGRRVYFDLAAAERAKVDVLLKQAEPDLIGGLRAEGAELIDALNALRG